MSNVSVAQSAKEMSNTVINSGINSSLNIDIARACNLPVISRVLDSSKQGSGMGPSVDSVSYWRGIMERMPFGGFDRDTQGYIASNISVERDSLGNILDVTLKGECSDRVLSEFNKNKEMLIAMANGKNATVDALQAKDYDKAKAYQDSIAGIKSNNEANKVTTAVSIAGAVAGGILLTPVTGGGSCVVAAGVISGITGGVAVYTGCEAGVQLAKLNENGVYDDINKVVNKHIQDLRDEGRIIPEQEEEVANLIQNYYYCSSYMSGSPLFYKDLGFNTFDEFLKQSIDVDMPNKGLLLPAQETVSCEAAVATAQAEVENTGATVSSKLVILKSNNPVLSKIYDSISK